MTERRRASAGLRRWLMLLGISSTVAVVALAFVAHTSTAGPPDATILLGVATVGQQQVPPEKIVGREKCTSCHKKELAAWSASSHGEDAWNLLDGSKATDYATKLGIAKSDIKTSLLCTSCHGTQQKSSGTLTIVHGNSCESCHGGAGGPGGWLEIHCDYDGDGSGIKKEMAVLLAEVPDELPSRIAEACKQAGMNRAEDALGIAKNCLQCHIVPHEGLLDAGHPSSEKFEFVEWNQGEVRHNFLLDQSKNSEAPSLWLKRGKGRSAENRKRLMYVVGMLADLEVSLRARADVTNKKSELLDLASERILDRAEDLDDLGLDALDDVMKIVKKYELDDDDVVEEFTSKDKETFTAAADAVMKAAQEFLQANKDGDKLDDIKKVPSKEKGDVFE